MDLGSVGSLVLRRGLGELSQSAGLGFGAALLLLGEFRIADDLLLGLDLAHLLLLLGQAALVGGTVGDAHKEQRPAAELDQRRNANGSLRHGSFLGVM